MDKRTAVEQFESAVAEAARKLSNAAKARDEADEKRVGELEAGLAKQYDLAHKLRHALSLARVALWRLKQETFPDASVKRLAAEAYAASNPGDVKPLVEPAPTLLEELVARGLRHRDTSTLQAWRSRLPEARTLLDGRASFGLQVAIQWHEHEAATASQISHLKAAAALRELLGKEVHLKARVEAAVKVSGGSPGLDERVSSAVQAAVDRVLEEEDRRG